MAKLILVDCEAPFGVGSPAVGDMTEFGAVDFDSRQTFHGKDCSRETFDAFRDWLMKLAWLDVTVGDKAHQLQFVSDNPAYDWQWINFYFWKYHGVNPFGFSARRIGDFAAGLNRNWKAANQWKTLRKTPHDHNPVHDALGNAEALEALLKLAK